MQLFKLSNSRTGRRSSVAGPMAAALIAATTGSALAGTVSGNLPSGTNISVAINTPANGAVLSPGPVAISGTASIGVGVPVPRTALVYVLDASGSTDSAADRAVVATRTAKGSRTG